MTNFDSNTETCRSQARETDGLEATVSLEPAPITIGGVDFYTAEDMQDVELEPVEWAVEGVFAKRRKHTLSGDPKIGKGHLVEQFGLCLATGIPFLDFPVLGTYRTLYLEFESDQATLRERVEIKREALRVSGSKFIYRAYPGEILLDTPGGLEKMCEILQALEDRGQPIDFLILDPKYRVIRGDLSQANQVRIWTTNVDALIKAFGIGFVLVDHTPKFQYDKGVHKSIGSILWTGWTDVVMVLEKHKGNRGKLEITGKIPETMKIDVSFDPATLFWSLSGPERMERMTKKDKAKSRILEMVATDGEAKEDTVKTQLRTEEIGHTTFHHALRELLEEDRIKSVPTVRNKRVLRFVDSTGT